MQNLVLGVLVDLCENPKVMIVSIVIQVINSSLKHRSNILERCFCVHVDIIYLYIHARLFLMLLHGSRQTIAQLGLCLQSYGELRSGTWACPENTKTL